MSINWSRVDRLPQSPSPESPLQNMDTINAHQDLGLPTQTSSASFTPSKRPTIDDAESSSSKKRRSSSQDPDSSLNRSTLRSRTYREKQIQAVKEVKDLERAGLPVSEDLKALAEKRRKMLKSNAQRQANYRRIKKNEDMVAGSNVIVEPAVSIDQEEHEKEINELKSNLAASNRQAMIDREEREKEINTLKSQLAALNQCAKINCEEREQEINALRSNLAASNQQAMIDREEHEKIKAQLAAVTQQSTISQQQAKEMNQLKLQLTTEKQQQAKLVLERQKEIKYLNEELTSTKQGLQRYKKEAKTLRPQLEAAKQQLEQAHQENPILEFEDIKCGICLGVMWQPGVLSCGHSFCASCLHHLGARVRECSLCRRITEIPREDRQLGSIIEKVAVSFDHLLPPPRLNFQNLKRFFDVIYVRPRPRP